MKIMQIDQNYQFGGGTEQYFLSIMDLLENKGHQQVVVFFNKTDKTITREWRKEYYLPGITEEFNRAMLGKLGTIINDEAPDIIYLHNVHNLFVIEQCLKLKPTIRFIHDPSLCCFTHWKLLPGLEKLCDDRLGFTCFSKGCLKFQRKNIAQYLWRKRSLYSHGKLKKVIVASQYMKRLLVQNGFSPSNIEINSYFVTTPPVDNVQERAKKDDICTIFYAGLIHKIKGVDLMLKALALVKNDFIALLAGSGEYFEEYKKMANDLGLEKNVKFLGWVPNENLMEYYKNADLVLVPSFWIEAFGIVGIEAMASSRPVIAFDTGGISEWLKDNVNGFLVPRGSSAVLAEKIDLLLSDARLRERMGKAGRKLYEDNFTKDIHLGKLINMMQRIK